MIFAPEPEKAFHFYKKAAEIDMKIGFSTSIFALARCYELGIGTEVSLKKAIHYYKFSVENGFTPGYYEAGSCYLKMGGDENKIKADFYYKLGDAAPKKNFSIYLNEF